MTDFHLCDRGMALYSAWSILCDTKARAALITAARNAYQAHKANCDECTDWAGVRRKLDRIAEEAE